MPTSMAHVPRPRRRTGPIVVVLTAIALAVLATAASPMLALAQTPAAAGVIAGRVTDAAAADGHGDRAGRGD